MEFSGQAGRGCDVLRKWATAPQAYGGHIAHERLARPRPIDRRHRIPTPSAMLQAEDTPSEATVPDPVTQGPVPRWYTDRAEHTIACDNGILRVRLTKLGIIWFDVYHPHDKRWYVNKNNLNLMTLVPGSGWQNTELDMCSRGWRSSHPTMTGWC